MRRSWKNLYKADLFHCGHRLHKHAENGTSAWHILKHKKCYPGGCITFNWKCRCFDQKRRCPRGKKHIGKDCFSCKFFYDEKNVFQPEARLSKLELQEFMTDFSEFEEWVGLILQRRIEIRGRVNRIMPHLVKRGDRHLSVVSRGVLLYFREGIFGYDRFLDPFYALLSARVYDSSDIAAGDEIDFKGVLEIDRGRFLYRRVGAIELVRPGAADHVPASRLTQARFTGSFIAGQPGKCLRCKHGLLIDDNIADGRSRPRRHMYCLKGVSDYRYCPYRE